MRQIALGLAALALVAFAGSTVLAAGPSHPMSGHGSVMTVGHYGSHGSGYGSGYGQNYGYGQKYSYGRSYRYGQGYRPHGGPMIIRPPVYGHPPVVVPFRGHPPVVHPPLYNRYRSYGPQNRMYFGGPSFGISIGF